MYKQGFDKERASMPKNPPVKKVEMVKTLAHKAGQYFNRIGSYEEAADVFLKANLLREAALSYDRKGDYAKAADLCLQLDDQERAAQFYIKGKFYDQAIDLYKNLGRLDEVADILEQAGKRSEAAELRGRLSLERKDTELGAKHLEDAGKFTEAAELYFEIKKFEKSALLYEKGEAYDQAAGIYERLKKYEEAAELYKKISRYKSAANCYKELDNSRSYLEMLLLGESYLEAARFYLDNDQNDSAIGILQKIEIDSPDYRLACNILGKLFAERSVDGLAREKLTLAVEGKEMGKRNLDLFYDLAVFKEAHGEEPESLQLYEKILSYDFYFKDVQDRRRLLENKMFTSHTQSSFDSSKEALSSSDGRKSQIKHDLKGQVLNNRYEIMEEIGRGGMGVVYKALDRSLDRFVALKFLPSDFIRNTKDIEKFINEAKSAAKLNHRNIVTIHNIDQVEGDYFIVMEYVDGANLKEIIDLAKNLPLKTVKLICIQMCDALSYAHKSNVIHRDIKNANIMWTNEKVVKITDFGLAKIVVDGLKTSTRVQGSPVYMSPEQVLGKNIDKRTDIYSLGISLYEMCTGKVPFERGDIGYHHLNTAPEPPEAIREDIPEFMSDIIKKCLSKKPEERFQTAQEILDELNQVTEN